MAKGKWERSDVSWGELELEQNLSVPTKTQLSNFLGTPGEDYFKGKPKSLNFYFLVIWWGKLWKLASFDMCLKHHFLKKC